MLEQHLAEIERKQEEEKTRLRAELEVEGEEATYIDEGNEQALARLKEEQIFKANTLSKQRF